MLNRTSRFSMLALALLFAAATLGCALPSPVPAEDGASTVADASVGTNAASSADSGSGGYIVNTTDMAGNAVQLSESVSSIIVLDPADCEILFALGAGDLIIGRTAGCDYPEEANLLPYVTVDNKADADLILLNKPQVVVLSAEDAQDTELMTALSGAGIVAVVTNAVDVNSMYSAISLLGTLTNHASEANALVSSLITSLAELQSKISQHDDTVYLELTPPSAGLTTAGSGTFAQSLITLLGFHNEFEDMSGTVAITQDQVVGRNPDVIITTTKSTPASTDQPEQTPLADGTTPEPQSVAVTGVEEILARADWQSLDAVVSKRVFYMDASLLTRAGPRILDAVNALYTILYESKQP